MIIFSGRNTFKTIQYNTVYNWRESRAEFPIEHIVRYNQWHIAIATPCLIYIGCYDSRLLQLVFTGPQIVIPSRTVSILCAIVNRTKLTIFAFLFIFSQPFRCNKGIKNTPVCGPSKIPCWMAASREFFNNIIITLSTS